MALGTQSHFECPGHLLPGHSVTWALYRLGTLSPGSRALGTQLPHRLPDTRHTGQYRLPGVVYSTVTDTVGGNSVPGTDFDCSFQAFTDTQADCQVGG